MRFNVASRGFKHPKYIFVHKKWDREPRFNPGWFRQWRRTFFWKSKVTVEEIPVPIASGYSAVDANEFVTEHREKWIHPEIWPYEKKYEKGSPDDPAYKPIMAHHFNRSTTIYEGFKGAMNFSNTVMEGEDNLPSCISSLEDNITIEDKFISLLEKRLQFAYEDDCLLTKTRKVRKWPRLDIKPRFGFGTPVSRTEGNVLNSFYDVSQLWINKYHHLIDRRRLNYPTVLVPFVRDNQLITLDLSCDFVTLVQKSSDNYLTPIFDKSEFYEEPSKTLDKKLISIHPCNWEICFDKTHWYSTDFAWSLPPKDQVHTIYLTDSRFRIKKFVDRFAKAKALMFCYGYGAAQFRLKHGNWNDHEDRINYQILEKPILVNSVFTNLSKNSVGFCTFQLNTTDFNSDVKNQVWFNGPYEINENKELILKKLIAMNLYGPYNQPTFLVNDKTTERDRAERSDSTSATL